MRTSLTTSTLDAYAAIDEARKSQIFEPAPRSIQGPPGGKLGVPGRCPHGLDAGLVERSKKHFDAQKQFRGEEVSTRVPRATNAEAARLYDAAHTAGQLPSTARKAVADKNGGVRAIDARGRTVKWLRTASRSKRGVVASAEEARAGRRLGRQTSQKAALRHVIGEAGDWLTGGTEAFNESTLRSMWEGYKRAHPGTRGFLRVSRSGRTAWIVDKRGVRKAQVRIS